MLVQCEPQIFACGWCRRAAAAPQHASRAGGSPCIAVLGNALPYFFIFYITNKDSDSDNCWEGGRLNRKKLISQHEG